MYHFNFGFAETLVSRPNVLAQIRSLGRGIMKLKLFVKWLFTSELHVAPINIAVIPVHVYWNSRGASTGNGTAAFEAVSLSDHT